MKKFLSAIAACCIVAVSAPAFAADAAAPPADAPSDAEGKPAPETKTKAGDRRKAGQKDTAQKSGANKNQRRTVRR